MSIEETDASVPSNVDNTSECHSGSNDVAKESVSEKLSIEERLAGKMLTHAREIICFLLAITFTTLAALHSSPPKISKPPLARPFFNQTSIVLDFYKGHLGAMVDRVTDSDFSFIMYYAPWDAECQVVRQEFESVAQYYHSQIFFAAINCWHPGSECRSQYNKIQSYPVLMLYPSRDSGIQYRGIRSAPYMIRFLDAFLHPLQRISNKSELHQLFNDYDSVVVGFFNFSGVRKSPGYKEYYKSAIRLLEKDPNRETIFAVVTDTDTARREFNVSKYPSVSLFMWNETVDYPYGNEWTPDGILNWLSNSIHQVTLWLQPPGVKALTLAPYLRDGPVLFLFTPRNPLQHDNYHYNLLREVGLEYYNCCFHNEAVNNTIESLRKKRHEAESRHKEMTEKCMQMIKASKARVNTPTISISIQQWINDSCCANIGMNKCSLCKKNIESFSKFCVPTSKTDEFEHVCKEVDVFNAAIPSMDRESFEFCCENRAMHERDEKLEKNNKTIDTQSSTHIKVVYKKEECRKFLAGNKYNPPVFVHDSAEHLPLEITKSMCESNKTLALIAIDSLHYFQFAEGLGIDVLKRKDKTVAVILDPAEESQYVMQEVLSRHSLVEFINNYTNGLLQRSLRSDTSRRFAQKFKTKVECQNDKDKSTICVADLTTETFLQTILDPTKDVVVMYHSPYCAFCSAIAYVYLTVAQYLSQMDHLLFVRIDGDNNDLPWEYTMNRYPSILFFPARRKEDSTVFPFSVPVTIANLLNFVLANLDGESHVEALINICNEGAGEAPNECVSRIRWLCLDIIEYLLKDYRQLRRHLRFYDKRLAANVKRAILLKLKHIKDVHLILSSTDDLERDVDKVELIRMKFRAFYKHISSINSSQSSLTSLPSTMSFMARSFQKNKLYLRRDRRDRINSIAKKLSNDLQQLETRISS